MAVVVALDVDAQAFQEAVHDPRVADLVLDDLGHLQGLLDIGGLGDPGHVAEGPGQLRVGLHHHQMGEVVAVFVRHFIGGVDFNFLFDLFPKPFFFLPFRQFHAVIPP